MSERSMPAGVERLGGSGRKAVLTRRRFSVEEYDAMARAGILGEDDRLELLDGEVFEMTPIGIEHMACVARLDHWCAQILRDRVVRWVQSAIRLSTRWAPQPDLTLLEPPLERYAKTYPEPSDVLLLVEVADASLATDRTVKLPLYAEASIREVWIVNLAERLLEIHRQPSAAGYADTRRAREGTVSPLAFPDEAIDLEEVLGPAK